MVMTSHPTYTPHTRDLYNRLILQQLCSGSGLQRKFYHDLFTLELGFMALRLHSLLNYLG
jgi:hypothetical protein